jgi:O-antigen/teichoic acid export membrane protein
VGALIGPAAVTSYVLAFGLASRVHALIAAGTEVLFPMVSGSTDHFNFRNTYLRMLAGSALVAALVLIPLALFAEPISTLWLGREAARDVAPLILVFSIGYFFTSLSPAPYHLANGVGRPGLNLANFAMRVGLNLLLLALFGIDGLSVEEIVLAFAVTAGVVDGIVWPIVTELVIWQRVTNPAWPSRLLARLLGS